MQWSDVIKPPSSKTLRQFAGLSLVVFGGLAAWRWAHADHGTVTIAMAVFAVVVGGIGLIAPQAVRPVYSGWMMLAFPIGWTLSKVALGLAFFIVFLPVGLVFRMLHRDALKLKRGSSTTYWTEKQGARAGEEYLRQY